MAIDSTVGTPIALSPPQGASYLTITHETYQQEPQMYVQDTALPPYPMLVDLDTNLLQVTTSYSWVPNSSGRYSVQWFASTTATSASATSYYNIYQPFVVDTDFFNDYPQYSTQNTTFVAKERKIRRLLEAYCGQTFQPWINKCVKVSGKNTNALSFDRPVLQLKQVLEASGYDLTYFSEIDPDSNFFVTRITQDYPFYEQKSDGLFYYNDIKRDSTYDAELVFKSGVDYYVTADFGSYDIPENIVEAAKLLIADEYSGIADMRNHGITQAQLGDYSYTIGELNSTTGNSQADMLIQDYVETLEVRMV